MDQELIFKASFMEKEANETQNEIEFVEKEIAELEKFSENLGFFANSSDKTMIASLGKGVLVKTQVTDKKLFVEVGSGIIVRKDAKEVIKVIKEQIARLNEARVRLVAKMGIIQNRLQELLLEIERSQQTA